MARRLAACFVVTNWSDAEPVIFMSDLTRLSCLRSSYLRIDAPANSTWGEGPTC